MSPRITDKLISIGVGTGIALTIAFFSIRYCAKLAFNQAKEYIDHKMNEHELNSKHIDSTVNYKLDTIINELKNINYGE